MLEAVSYKNGWLQVNNFNAGVELAKIIKENDSIAGSKSNFLLFAGEKKLNWYNAYM